MRKRFDAVGNRHLRNWAARRARGIRLTQRLIVPLSIASVQRRTHRRCVPPLFLGLVDRRHTFYSCRMTMLSFRVDDDEAAATQRWADELGIDKSELLREALHRHLTRLATEHDDERWLATPLTEDESAIGHIADWGPAEDWSDWADAAR